LIVCLFVCWGETEFGVKRERAPFVFTPDFAYVMGGKDARDFNRFVELCQRAYNLLRKSSSLFINLFAMVRMVKFSFEGLTL